MHLVLFLCSPNTFVVLTYTLQCCLWEKCIMRTDASMVYIVVIFKIKNSLTVLYQEFGRNLIGGKWPQICEDILSTLFLISMENIHCTCAPKCLGISVLFLMLKMLMLISIKTYVVLIEFKAIIHTMQYHLSAIKNKIDSQTGPQEMFLYIF